MGGIGLNPAKYPNEIVLSVARMYWERDQNPFDESNAKAFEADIVSAVNLGKPIHEIIVSDITEAKARASMISETIRIATGSVIWSEQNLARYCIDLKPPLSAPFKIGIITTPDAFGVCRGTRVGGECNRVIKPKLVEGWGVWVMPNMCSSCVDAIDEWVETRKRLEREARKAEKERAEEEAKAKAKSGKF